MNSYSHENLDYSYIRNPAKLSNAFENPPAETENNCMENLFNLQPTH
jgi:hypothetical protein